MKFIYIFFALTFSALAQTNVERDIKAIKEYVIKMNKRVVELEKKVADLEARLQGQGQAAPLEAPARDQQAVLQDRAPDPAHQIVYDRFPEGADKAALLAIVPPAQFDRNNIKTYLKSISTAVANQNSFGSDDYAIGLLMKVPREFFEDLINYDALDSYVDFAMPNMVTEQDREFVYKHLFAHPQLVDAVVRYPQWEASAWPLLVRGLKTLEYIPAEWVLLVARKNRADGNAAIYDHLESNAHPYVVEKLVDLMDRRKLGSACIKNWKTNKDQYNRVSSAICAMGFGDKAALKFVLSSFNNDTSDGYKQTIIAWLTKYSESQGDPVEWHTQNAARISFDSTTGRWKLP